jgi:ATP/maltotriose-dependent transcriptional regulator MalT
VTSRRTGARGEDVTVVGRAERALAEHQWETAHKVATIGVPNAEPLVEAALLDVQAEASWWLGRLDECIDAREAAYAIFERQGESRRAGQCAVWLYEHYCFKAQPAIGGAWLRRARHRLAGAADCIEYGNLVLRETEVAHGGGNLEAAAANAAAMVDLARRLRSADLEAQALQTVGRVLIDQGRATEGVGYLDEAMLLALDGGLTPYTTGKVYCSLISACELLGDFRRASEWIDATSRWSERHPFALFPGLCRVHHGWALQCRGELALAEQEVERACGQLSGISRAHLIAAYVELGEIRRRLGNLDGAEAAFHEVEAVSGRPHAGVALLRLAQGRPAAATTIITQALEGETWNRLARSKLLPACIQIAVATGELAAAAAAADELDAIAADFDRPALTAMAASARGRLLLAQGDPNGACVALRRAVELWQELEVPYEVGTARLLLGEASRANGDEEASLVAFRAAEAIFEELGVKVDRPPAAVAPRPAGLPAGLTEREAEVLRLVATGCTNREIATQLFLSEKTVARHLSNIFTKIGVHTRSAATAFAFGHGIVSDQDGALPRL